MNAATKPPAIRTWRQRIGAGPDFPLHAPNDVERAMEAEIAELRAGAADLAKDAALRDALNTTLWLYRRLPHVYGKPEFVDRAILTMAEHLGMDDVPAAINERAAIAHSTETHKDAT